MNPRVELERAVCAVLDDPAQPTIPNAFAAVWGALYAYGRGAGYSAHDLLAGVRHWSQQLALEPVAPVLRHVQPLEGIGERLTRRGSRAARVAGARAIELALEQHAVGMTANEILASLWAASFRHGRAFGYQPAALLLAAESWFAELAAGESGAPAFQSMLELDRGGAA